MQGGMDDNGVSPQFRTLMRQGQVLVSENLDKLRALQGRVGPAPRV